MRRAPRYQAEGDLLRERAAPRFNVPTFGDGLMGRPCTQLDVSRAVGRTTAGPLTPDDAGRQVPAPMPTWCRRLNLNSDRHSAAIGAQRTRSND